MNPSESADLSDAANTLLAELAALKPNRVPTSGDEGWLADFRSQTAALARFGGPAEPLHDVRHAVIEGVGGPLVVRLYRPRAGPLPVLLHLRGGGGIAGSLDGHDIALRTLAKRTGWAVAAPDYRMAPASRFPAQLDDGEAALRWLTENSASLKFDSDRIVVSGDSIGGTLATALAVRARDAALPLAGQVLLYPNTDLRHDAHYPSRKSQDGRIIAIDDLERQIALYLDTAEQRTDPEASPLLQSRVSGLPPTLLVTCEADPLRDEGELYGAQLAQTGVVVSHLRLRGALHAVLQMGGRVDETRILLNHVSDWLDRLEDASG